MKFARIVYRVAAIYGLVTLTPLYFAIDRIGSDAPPDVTHPEFYFGFLGLALIWQFVFFAIAADPIRYRTLMLPAILEKFVYSVPVMILYAMGKADTVILLLALVDPIFGMLFIAAHFRTGGKELRY